MSYPLDTYNGHTMQPKPQVVKSLFCESATNYQPMYLRTYQQSTTQELTGDVLKSVSDAINFGAGGISKNAMAKVASNIITPSAAPSAMLTIDEGWGTKRFTFAIELQAQSNNMLGNTTVVLTGYTNYTDVSPVSKTFDPQMRLYFNSSSLVNTITTRLPNGQITNKRVLTDASHLLGANVVNNIVKQNTFGFTPGLNEYENSTSWLLPKNVIDQMQTQVVMQQSSWDSPVADLDFRRIANPNHVKRSKRTNAVAGDYLHSILNNVTNELRKTTGIGDDDYVALGEAAYNVKETDVNVDPILTLLIVNTNFNINGYITWSEFCHLFDGADERTVYTTRDFQPVQTGSFNPVDVSDTEHWGGVTYETTIANYISQLVPAIMVNSLLGNVNFIVTNDNVTLTPEVTVFMANSLIDGVQASDLVGQFQHRLINEVYPLISNNGQSVITVMVQSNIGTETYINVSYNGGSPTPYCAPTFCDAMFTPIVSPTNTGIENLASGLLQVANDVVNNTSY